VRLSFDAGSDLREYRTHKGDFRPQEFVWIPEGEKMFHGATADNDVIFILQLTGRNK